jgi:hypothetical protein
MDTELADVIRFLSAHKIRATYGAVAELLGVLPISMGARIGPHTLDASWIVSGESGLPTGYAPTETHPDVLTSTRLIRSGAELAAAIGPRVDPTGGPPLSQVPPSSGGEHTSTPLAPSDRRSLRLPSGGRSYEVRIEAMCWQPLNRGLLTYSFDAPDFLREYTADCLDAFKAGLVALWPWIDTWTLLSPLPDYLDPQFQRQSVVEGRLCAAILTSTDDFFPGIPGTSDDPMDYSQASVLWILEEGEDTLPARIFSQIDWERVARPAAF